MSIHSRLRRQIRNSAPSAIYHVRSSSRRREPRLTPHPWKCFEQPLKLSNETALSAIPQYHIVCTSTLGTRDPELMAKARASGRLWDIDTGHDLMITEPHAVAAILGQIASA